MGKVRLFTIVFVVGLLVGLAQNARAQQGQPGYDALRIVSDGTAVPYRVWVDWAPLLITTPDGGAWAFVSATVRLPSKAATPPATPTPTVGTERLYAAHFDPKAGVWDAAQALPGGEIQFGPSAVVAPDGTVHLVYTDRAKDVSNVFGTLVYTHSDGKGGWTPPVQVAPNPNAGHQATPSLTMDGTGKLHVLWQDQRAVDPAARAAAASNADIFASDLTNGAWSAPVQVNKRTSPTINASRPRVLVDGQRLVAVWSVYDAAALDSALRVEWSTRPLNDEKAWTPPQTLLDRGGNNSQIGGRLLDVAADPKGGAVLVYGRRTGGSTATPQAIARNDLFLRRLPAGGNAWGNDLLLTSGDRGSFPALAVRGDGTIFVVYNFGHGTAVQVGALALAPGAAKPGPEVVLTQGEDGAQGRAVIAVAATGNPWVVYLHEPPGQSGNVNEVRCVRGAQIPTA